MSKPFMCGDEVAVYIPDGGCDCNYTIRRVETTEYAGLYELTLQGTAVGDIIEVPLDYQVVSGVLNQVTTPNVPYDGAAVGDKYIHLEVSNTHDSHPLYVPLGDLGLSNYYTKAEVDNLINSINSYVVVDELPETGDSSHIYMVDNGHGGYDRYIWVDNDWVNIGSTNIDLTDYYTKTQTDALLADHPSTSEIVDLIYPVGSIYMNVSETADPSLLFTGTTWQRLEDRFLLGAGNTYAEGAVGGAEKVDLSETNLPYISGTIEFRPWKRTNVGGIVGATTGKFSNQGQVGSNSYPNYGDNSSSNPNTKITYAFGNSNASTRPHNNMPPYLAVYMWKRVS